VPGSEFGVEGGVFQVQGLAQPPDPTQGLSGQGQVLLRLASVLCGLSVWRFWMLEPYKRHSSRGYKPPAPHVFEDFCFVGVSVEVGLLEAALVAGHQLLKDMRRCACRQ